MFRHLQENFIVGFPCLIKCKLFGIENIFNCKELWEVSYFYNKNLPIYCFNLSYLLFTFNEFNLFQEKRDREVHSIVMGEENEITEDQISKIRSSIPPVELGDVDVPADSDDEDAKRDLALKRKIHLENGRRVARSNQRRGRRIVNAIHGMAQKRMEHTTVSQLMEIAGAGEDDEQVRQNASLTPLRSSSAANAEAALRSNEKRGRLALNKGGRVRGTSTNSVSARNVDQRGPSRELESFRFTAGAIRASANIDDAFHIPDCTSDDMNLLSQIN